MKIILLFFGAWFISALIRTIRERKAQKEQPEVEDIQPEERDIKAEKRRETLLYNIRKAESDVANDQDRLDHYTAELSAMDETVEKLETDIEFYHRANQLDSEVKARKEKERLQNRIFSFEEKVRACEKRMERAQHIKTLAQIELSA